MKKQSYLQPIAFIMVRQVKSKSLYTECPIDMGDTLQLNYLIFKTPYLVFQNVRPVLKTLFQDLLDGTLTLSYIRQTASKSKSNIKKDLKDGKKTSLKIGRDCEHLTFFS